jgi:hypothetical protein
MLKDGKFFGRRQNEQVRRGRHWGWWARERGVQIAF